VSADDDRRRRTRRSNAALPRTDGCLNLICYQLAAAIRSSQVATTTDAGSP
jgi:hypothetical protein